MAGRRRAGDPRGTRPPLPLHPGDQCFQWAGIWRSANGSSPNRSLGWAVGLGGIPALAAPPAALVELAVAAPRLRRALHDFGPTGLAARLAGSGREATAPGSRGRPSDVR